MSIQLSPLFSGSSGNAVYLSDGTTSILIDGGVSAKRIVHALTKLGVAPDSLSAMNIVITLMASALWPVPFPCPFMPPVALGVACKTWWAT